MKKKAIPNSQHRTYLKHPRDKGDWAEMRFMAEATRRGLIVSRPYGAVAFDFAVCPKKGPFSRVQVKSVWSIHGGCYRIRTSHQRGRLYRRGEIDFIVGYVVPEDVWYIIPISEIRYGSAYFVPHVPGSRARWEKFREAWGLLRGEEPGFGFEISACADPNVIAGSAENAEEIHFPPMDADFSGCYLLDRTLAAGA